MKYIGFYSKSNDKFVGECKLSVEIKTISMILKPHEDDPLFDMVYPLNSSAVQKLIQYTEDCRDHLVNVKNYNYFLESFRD